MSSDLFLQLSSNPQTKKLIQNLGLPLPMPQPLARPKGPYQDRPLDGHEVLVAGGLKGAMGSAIASGIIEAGANPWVFGETDVFDEPGEAWGHRPTFIGAEPSEDARPRYDAIVFDATELSSSAELKELYTFFHPWVPRLARCGRIVVIGRPPSSAKSAGAAAAQQALEGFVRSLAKEFGRKGATANLLRVEEGAEGRLEGPLRFFLSRRSAYVTAQPITVSNTAKAPESTPRVRPLAGKVALVTGAARGIGAACARIMADEGAKVLLLDRPDDDGPLSKVARDLGAEMVLVDVTAEDAPAKVLAAAKEHGGIDVVVHNAGVTRDKTLAKMSEAQWDLTLGVNLDAIMKIDAALIEAGAINEGGRMVCLSSVSGIAGNMGQTNYAASKAGVVGYIQFLSAQVAGKGITVNAIAPGFIETRLTDAMPVMIREGARRLSALGQGGLPSDVGQAITFLSTPGAGGITGNVLRVCGGALVGS